jgi:hypothetical protein
MLARIAGAGTLYSPYGNMVTSAHRVEVKVGADGNASAPPSMPPPLRRLHVKALEHGQIVDGHGEAEFFEQVVIRRIDMFLVRQDNTGKKPSFPVRGSRCKTTLMPKALVLPTSSTTTT